MVGHRIDVFHREQLPGSQHRQPLRRRRARGSRPAHPIGKHEVVIPRGKELGVPETPLIQWQMLRPHVWEIRGIDAVFLQPLHEGLPEQRGLRSSVFRIIGRGHEMPVGVSDRRPEDHVDHFRDSGDLHGNLIEDGSVSEA